MTELRNCPFCGGAVHAELMLGYTDGRWGVHCSAHCPTGGLFLVIEFSEAEAITAWNTRASPTTPVELKDGLRVAGLLKNIGVMETALKQIAGSHYERWGMDQTDVEEVPDLSGDEAMNIARAALENTNDKG